MPTKLNGTLWVSRAELLQAGIGGKAIDLYVYRNKPRTLKKGVYALEGLPASYQEAVKKAFGEETAEYTAPKMSKYPLLEGWQEYMPLYEGIDNTELWAKSASCFCNFIASIGNVATLPAIRTGYIEYLSTVQHNSLHLPQNERALQRKVQQYLRGTPVYQLVYPARTGNSNASKYDEALYAYVMDLRANPNNYTDRHIWRMAKKYAQSKNIPRPSLSWVKNILKDGYTKVLTQSRWDKVAGGFTPLKKDIKAGEIWQIDGTRVNFIPHTHEGQKKSLYIIAVLDVFSRAILGYALCHAESYANVANALKTAIENTQKVPQKLITDRFPGHNTEEAKMLLQKLKKMGVETSLTHKATGKSHIERAFGTLQSVFMQDVPVYYGEGIRSTRPYAHKSESALKNIAKTAHHQHGYTYEEACALMDNVVYQYNHTLLSEYSDKNIQQSPYDIYHAHVSDKLYPAQPHHIAWLFWEKRTLKVRENLIEYHKNYEEHYFFIYDTETLKQVAGKEVEVYTNDEVVYIYSGGQYAGMAEREMPVSITDYKAINEVKNKKKALQKALKEEFNALTQPLREEQEEADESLLLMPLTTPKPLKEQQESTLLKNMLEDPYDYI